jgi:hypothetical protein
MGFQVANGPGYLPRLEELLGKLGAGSDKLDAEVFPGDRVAALAGKLRQELGGIGLPASRSSAVYPLFWWVLTGPLARTSEAALKAIVSHTPLA